jgi:hypothetical protein
MQIVKNADGSYRSVVDAAITDTDLHHSPAADGKVWFVKDGLLQSYDIAAKAVQATTVRPDLDVTGYSWENGTLAGLGTGPDGKIYTGGYLTGGTGVYDPLHGDADDNHPDTKTRTGLNQTDSLLAHDGKLYIGVYRRPGCTATSRAAHGRRSCSTPAAPRATRPPTAVRARARRRRTAPTHWPARPTGPSTWERCRSTASAAAR